VRSSLPVGRNARVKIPANQLSTHLRNSLLPCYLVSGDEPLLVQEASDTLRRKARELGMETRDLYVADARFDWDELNSSASNLSLFAERRIIELRLPTGKPGRHGGAAIVRLVEQAGADLLLIVSTPKLDRQAVAATWVKAIDKRGGSIQLWPVSLAELPRWIGDRMRRAGLAPERDAIQLLADRVEGNLLAAQQEIEKLRLQVGEGKITVSDVEAAVADSSRYDVYKLVDAATGGDAARAIRILGGLRSEGTEPVIVVWALSRELRTLANLADHVQGGVELSAALQKAGVWRNRQGLIRACIGRLQPGEAHRLLKLARDADAAAKGQAAGDPWSLAADIVIGLSRGLNKAA
jgi:DNA polymerase-3 subunit delta